MIHFKRRLERKSRKVLASPTSPNNLARFSQLFRELHKRGMKPQCAPRLRYAPHRVPARTAAVVRRLAELDQTAAPAPVSWPTPTLTISSLRTTTSSREPPKVPQDSGTHSRPRSNIVHTHSLTSRFPLAVSQYSARVDVHYPFLHCSVAPSSTHTNTH